MCDEHYEEDLANASRFPPMTRRQLATASLGVGVAVMLPRTAKAQAVKESDAFPSSAASLKAFGGGSAGPGAIAVSVPA